MQLLLSLCLHITGTYYGKKSLLENIYLGVFSRNLLLNFPNQLSKHQMKIVIQEAFLICKDLLLLTPSSVQKYPVYPFLSPMISTQI